MNVEDLALRALRDGDRIGVLELSGGVADRYLAAGTLL
jgi:hypothetical protein